MFDDVEAEEKKAQHYETLRLKLTDFLKLERTNEEVFEFILRNEYLPAHATPILKELQDQHLLNINYMFERGEVRKGSFYISSDGIKNKKVKMKINS